MPRARRIERDAVISGILLLDKPAGWSSNQALGKAKRLLGERKAGHTGTLDPFATGLLPLLFGEATKFSADLLDADKAYEATAQLGVRTSTGDIEGEAIEVRPVVVTSAQVDTAISSFRGEIAQVPPMHSALKRDGQPLYVLARKGIEVERAPRRVTIHELRVLEFAGDRLRFFARCSKGTYVRTLAEDIGAALGCGAHLLALRRVLVGSLSVNDALTIEALEALEPQARIEGLAPADALLQGLARIDLDEALAARFVQGQRLKLNVNTSGRVRVYGAQQLLGTAVLEPDGRLQPQRLMAYRD
jgi:tRNA pseudouridine55 synthase